MWFSLERSSVASRAFFSILTDFLFAPPLSAKVALLNQNSWAQDLGRRGGVKTEIICLILLTALPSSGSSLLSPPRCPSLSYLPYATVTSFCLEKIPCPLWVVMALFMPSSYWIAEGAYEITLNPVKSWCDVPGVSSSLRTLDGVFKRPPEVLESYSSAVKNTHCSLRRVGMCQATQSTSTAGMLSSGLHGHLHTHIHITNKSFFFFCFWRQDFSKNPVMVWSWSWLSLNSQRLTSLSLPPKCSD